jgi:uroporphyrinogen-III decarboxylase
MNQRERYLETLLYGNPDKIPFEPGEPREKTLQRWYSEGLPKGVNWFEYLCKSIEIEHPESINIQPEINLHMLPTFEEKVIEHKNGSYIVQDWMGNITEISDEYDYTYIREAKDFVTRKWHAFPVNNPSDFEKMKKRYNPYEPNRYPTDFMDRLKVMKDRDYITSITIPGPFWQLREWCGFEPLCMMFITDPDFIKEMILFWTDFVSKTLKKCLDEECIDRIFINEDMAYKGKSMISPKMTKEFLLPTWKKWIKEAKKANVKILDMDSDGMVEELIPIWIDAGFNVCDPIEVAAGNDINKYRELYGCKIAFRQGVDKRCIAAGKSKIEEELKRLDPVIKSGGFIPGCDHGVPSDISWPDFVNYSRILAELTGWL